jgi:hypothetical protein
VAEGVGGQSRVAYGFWAQCSEGVPKLMGWKAGIPRWWASWRQMCWAPAMVSRLEEVFLLAGWKP